LYDSRNVTMQDVSGPSDGVFVRLQGDKTKEIHLKGPNVSQIKDRIQLGKGVQLDAIIMSP